ERYKRASDSTNIPIKDSEVYRLSVKEGETLKVMELLQSGNISEFNKLRKQGNFVSLDLRAANLERANLRAADLGAADLKGAYLSTAKNLPISRVDAISRGAII